MYLSSKSTLISKRLVALSLAFFLLFSLGAQIGCSRKVKQGTETEKTTQKEPKKDKDRNYVTITTKYGNMVLRLSDATPKHRDNFIRLAKTGYLDGTLFHRIIPQFMVQGGDPDSKNATPGAMLGNGGPDSTIAAEFVDSLIHLRGALAAAREGDQVNPTKASSGSQFYIVHGRKFSAADLQRMNKGYTPEQIAAYVAQGGAPHLDRNYTVFGYLVSGFNILDSIAAQPRNGMDRPINDLKMTVKVGR